MNQTKLSKLREHFVAGRIIHVQVAAGAHASLPFSPAGGYRLCHFSDNARSVWVVNPATDYPCKVGFEGLLSYEVAALPVIPKSRTPKPKKVGATKCIVWCPTAQRPPTVVHESQAKAEQVVKEMAARYQGSEFFVAALVARAKQDIPTNPPVLFEQLS